LGAHLVNAPELGSAQVILPLYCRLNKIEDICGWVAILLLRGSPTACGSHRLTPYPEQREAAEDARRSNALDLEDHRVRGLQHAHQ
jgi:hypothetical protein